MSQCYVCQKGSLLPKAGTWTEMMLPLIMRFEVAAALNIPAVHNGDGAAAIARLMRDMAGRLDYAIANNYRPAAAPPLRGSTIADSDGDDGA